VEIDSFIKEGEEEKPCLVRALNEYDQSSEWRKSLEVSFGDIMSREIINNISSVSKWLC